jgi:hypothetical protein
MFFISFNYFGVVEIIVLNMYPAASDPCGTLAAEESPASAADKKPKCIETTVVVWCIHGYTFIEKHTDKIKRSNKPVPQTSEKSVSMTGQTGAN